MRGNPGQDRQAEAAWIARILAARDRGDPEPYGEIVERYSGRVYSLVFGLVGDRVGAEDVCQETFVKVFRSLHSFAGSSSLFTWIYRIAVNSAHDHNKKAWRHRSLSLSTLAGDDQASQDLPDPSGGVQGEDALALEETIQGVHQALAALPRNYREILVLREIDGLAYDEIGRVLGLKKGTVESRLFRARQMLRQVAERLQLETLL